MSLRTLLPLALLTLAACKHKPPEPAAPPPYEQADYKTDAPEWLHQGTKLTFDVKTNKGEHAQTVEVTDVDPVVSFQWKNEGGGSGARTITADDLAHADQLESYFTDGENGPHAGKTTYWLSRQTFDVLVKAGKTPLGIDGEQRSLQYVAKESYKLTVNGADKELPVVHAVTGKGDELWILANTVHPIVVRATLASGHEWTLTKID